MNYQKFFLLFSTLTVALILVAPVVEAQNTAATSKPTSSAQVEVIQFHSEHRCMTCNKIEALTRETLKSYPSLTFSLVNVDDPKNEKKAEAFEATGTALFLYNSKTGKKKDLTDFAFMHAKNKEKFIEGLKKEIDAFLKM